MKVAIIGSRNLEIEKHLPKNTSLVISGGAKGVDALAEKYSDKNGIPKLIFLPDYNKYVKIAPLIRNKLISEMQICNGFLYTCMKLVTPPGFLPCT